MQVSLSSVFAFLRNAGSIAAIVIGAAGTSGLPTGVRAVLVAIGGVIQGIEHLNAGSTPAPAVKPVASATTAATLIPGRPAVPPVPPTA
jgi:hypothetical protein